MTPATPPPPQSSPRPPSHIVSSPSGSSIPLSERIATMKQKRSKKFSQTTISLSSGYASFLTKELIILLHRCRHQNRRRRRFLYVQPHNHYDDRRYRRRPPPPPHTFCLLTSLNQAVSAISLRDQHRPLPSPKSARPIKIHCHQHHRCRRRPRRDRAR